MNNPAQPRLVSFGNCTKANSRKGQEDIPRRTRIADLAS